MRESVSAEMRRFNYLIGEIDAVYHEAALKLGLSDSALSVLYSLCNHDGSCSLREMILLSGVSKQTVNSSLRKLENRGLICLELLDEKKKTVSLTERVKTFAQNTALRVVEIENRIFASWKQEERDQYLTLTLRYLSALKEEISAM